MTTPDTLAAALDRSRAFFRDRETRAGIVARRVLRIPRPADAELTDHLLRERRRRSTMDGSIGHSLVETARAAWEMLELGAPADNAGVVRMIGYLLKQQDAPGRWSEDGMAGDGFFSPAPPGETIAPLVLPSGTRFDDEDDARFVASCLALRTVLRAGHDRRASVRTHVERLLALRVLDPHLAFVAVGALGMAGPDYRNRLEPLLAVVRETQRDDGSWPEVTVFHAVDLLSSVPLADARACLKRAAPFIVSQQTPAGAFDATASEDIALIAVRVLDTVQGM